VKCKRLRGEDILRGRFFVQFLILQLGIDKCRHFFSECVRSAVDGPLHSKRGGEFVILGERSPIARRNLRMERPQESFIHRNPVKCYFVLAFAVSWAGALAVAAIPLIRHEPLPKMTGILMFPAMLLGPSLAGILLTLYLDGTKGLQGLVSRIFRKRIPGKWFGPLLIPPALILGVLFFLKEIVSPVYSPNLFLFGILFGVPAGFLEEIGWTGFAFPRMHLKNDAQGPSILLGALWSCWHLPVINYLGTASPHGDYWLAYFFAFAFAMTAMRVLIGWLYTNTKSVLIAQLMHVSSTGSLVVFSAPRVSAGQEVMWYGVYGVLLWGLVLVVAKIYGKRLTRQAG
jgi:uncharacterized protein